MTRPSLAFLICLTLLGPLAAKVWGTTLSASPPLAPSTASTLSTASTASRAAAPTTHTALLRRVAQDAMVMSESDLVAAVSYKRRQWIARMTCDLARAYQATGQGVYARRAALLLDRLAQVYPSYADSEAGKEKMGGAAQKRRAFGSSAFGSGTRRASANELWVSSELPPAYDLVRASREVGDLSRQRGYDVARRIEKDLLRRMADLAMGESAIPAGGPASRLRHEIAGKMSMPPAIAGKTSIRSALAGLASLDDVREEAPRILAVARIGRAVGEPRYVHWAWERVGAILEQVQYDGTMPGEIPGFPSFLSRDLPLAVDALKGYSDPPGTETLARRFDDYGDDDIRRDFPLLAVLQEDPWRRIALPTGSFPLGETQGPMVERTEGRVGGAPVGHEEDAHPAVVLLGALGHAVLRTGSGADAIQANLSFSQTSGQWRHADFLNLSLFAFGHEMLSDFGSAREPLSRWTRTAQAHNTVVVNDDPDGGAAGRQAGRVDLIVSRPGFLTAIAASDASGAGLQPVGRHGQDAHATASGARGAMRRLIVLVDAAVGRPYLLDVFAVRGGTRHDYVVHGSAVGDTNAEANVALEASDAPVLSIPREFEAERRQGVARPEWNVTFRNGERPRLGVRIHDGGCGATTLTLCRTLSRLSARQGPDAPRPEDYRTARLVARREGPAPLASGFVAVIEPFREGPWIESVENVPLTGGTLAVAVRVRMGAVCHMIVAALGESPARVETADGLVFDGRLGLLVEEDERVVRALLVGGREMSKGTFHLESPRAEWTGQIASAQDETVDKAIRGVFSTSAPLPGDSASRADWIVVNHDAAASHAYPIERIETRKSGGARGTGGAKIVLREAHGLEVRDGFVTSERCYPGREFRRRSDFRIDAVAEFVAQGDVP